MNEKFHSSHLLQNVKILLTEEQLDDIIEWFDTNSVQETLKEGPTNVITIGQYRQFLDLKKFHKRHFHYPSYMEIMTDAERLTAGGPMLLTQEQFIYVLNKYIILPNIKHEVRLAFDVFDREKRKFLDIDEIREIVTNYADAFDEAEVCEMIRDANVRGDGNVFYEDFLKSMFSIAPELQDVEVEFLYDDPDEDPSVPKDPVVEEPEEPPPPPKKPDKKDKKKK